MPNITVFPKPYSVKACIMQQFFSNTCQNRQIILQRMYIGTVLETSSWDEILYCEMYFSMGNYVNANNPEITLATQKY